MIIVPNKDEIQQSLEELRIIAGMMREHNDQVKDLMGRRKEIILKLRKSHVTYQQMSEYLGTTYQNIYKIVRDEIPRDEHGMAKKGRPRKEQS